MPVPDGLSNIVAISLSKEWEGKNLALRNDGTVVEWGNRPGPANVVGGLSNAVAIAAGRGHNLALQKDGAVFGWGNNNLGQATGVPTKEAPYRTNGLVQIDGHVMENVVAIAAGGDFSLALNKDGNILVWGTNNFHTPGVPAGLSNVVAIAAGETFCLAITTNATVANSFSKR